MQIPIDDGYPHPSRQLIPRVCGSEGGDVYGGRDGSKAEGGRRFQESSEEEEEGRYWTVVVLDESDARYLLCSMHGVVAL